jgi:hypothetical protein
LGGLRVARLLATTMHRRLRSGTGDHVAGPIPKPGCRVFEAPRGHQSLRAELVERFEERRAKERKSRPRSA